jgi:hypothetical protein
MRRHILPILLLLFITSPSLAGDQTHDPSRLILGGGTFNVIDDLDIQRTHEIRLEARLSEIPVWKMHPWFGAELTKGGKVGWYGAGLESDIDLWDDWLVLTLQTGAGYFDDGNERIPGMQYLPKSGFEFRHTAEIGVRLGNDGARVGVGFSHMSNANIGGGNNSVHALAVNVHFPLGFTPGRKSRPD